MNNRFRVIGEFQCLPLPELESVLSDPKAKNFFVSGYYDYDNEQLILFRGSGTSLTVPALFFESSANCSPDFNLFKLTDYGQTVKLGEYEIANHTILRAFDPEFAEEFKSNEIRFRN